MAEVLEAKASASSLTSVVLAYNGLICLASIGIAEEAVETAASMAFVGLKLANKSG